MHNHNEKLPGRECPKCKALSLYVINHVDYTLGDRPIGCTQCRFRGYINIEDEIYWFVDA